MEFLELIGDWLNAATAWLERFITNLFGSSNERRVRKIGFYRDKDGNSHIVPGSIIDRINQLEPEMQKLTDDELRQSTAKFRKRLAAGETLDDLLPEAFAAVREAGRRYLRMRHYDVQLVGGYILHKGMIAEMVTGEGKTLVATLAAYLNGLAGKVHVVTVNDYLARRDMEWMGPLYLGLGMTVGAIQSQMGVEERKKAYACDITYGTNNEFGFDYLRDNMKPTKEMQVQGPLDYAIIDEIDNILIDEARTPLIISGPAMDDVTKYAKANRIALQLKRDVHFEVKEKEHTCHLTDEGIRYAEQLAAEYGYIREGDSFYTAGNMEWPHLIDNALKAHHLYKRDVHYVVENGEVIIVDEFTGRKMYGRQWSDGLHQAVEAKEGVPIKQETQTLATITIQNYFKLYKKLAGMTGTAMTEAEEFWKIYKLDVISVPTNKPLRRINYPDKIYRTEKEKWDAVVEEIRRIHATGRPILVGTVSIEKSEMLSNRLRKYGIKHNVLNAKYHEREAEIIAQAGRLGAVTISTNMAGRGTDIILGGNPEYLAWEELKHKYPSRLDVPKEEWEAVTRRIAEREKMYEEGRKVAELGGLHVIGTERHEARRIDLQLRGRAGRQGDPGSSRFFVSLEDDLMRIFAGDWVKNMLTKLGMQEGESIESPMVTRQIEKAQKRVEERHFEMRKHLLDYDEVMDEQRKRVYSYRQRILDGCDCRQLILDMIDQQLERWVPHFLDPAYRWESISQWCAQQLRIDVAPDDIEGMNKEQLVAYLRDEAERQAEDAVMEQIEECLPEEEDPSEWNWLALAKWANTRWGLNLNDRELKKVGRDNLFHYILERVRPALQHIDFTPLDSFLHEHFCQASLCGWLYHQYTLRMRPEEFVDLSVEDAIELIRSRVHEQYREKEIRFPVAVGMTSFLTDRGQSEQMGREALARWASERFEADITAKDFKNKSRREIEELLVEHSRRFFEKGKEIAELDERLDKVFATDEEEPDTAARPSLFSFGTPKEVVSSNGRPVQSFEALQELVQWANERFKCDLKADELKSLNRDQLRTRIYQEYQRRYRPELWHSERVLILEVLDTAWKDHLYYMDHLRSGIGLMGYAQKDPKVEYRREGMRAFRDMWDRVHGQVSQAIFRLEKQSPEFVGSLWVITATEHAAAQPVTEDGSDGRRGNGARRPEPGQEVRAVEPIRNRGPKIGRNDPCPCGSGKKYKKCCGARV